AEERCSIALDRQGDVYGSISLVRFRRRAVGLGERLPAICVDRTLCVDRSARLDSRAAIAAAKPPGSARHVGGRIYTCNLSRLSPLWSARILLLGRTRPSGLSLTRRAILRGP